MKGKKLISLVVSIAMLLSMLSLQFAVAAEETVEEVYEEEVFEASEEFLMEIDFLKEIGLLSAEFEAGNDVTRGEMTQMIISAIYPDLDFSVNEGVPQFADVPAGHTYYSSIKACKELGIVSGDALSNFNPDSFATATEFVAMIVNALGYTPYAVAQGGYPTGYYLVAANSGITSGVSVAGATLKSEVAAKILYNALFADSVELKEISSNGITVEINTDKNMLSQRLGIFEYDAKVIDDGYSAMYGASIDDAERFIIEETSTGNRLIAYKNGLNLSEYLGKRVKIFIRNDVQSERYECVYVTPHKKMKSVEIVASSIYNPETISTYVEYEKNKDDLNISKINLSANPKLIKNGEALVTAQLKNNVPVNGLLTFIDNDGDSKYEIVDILNFDYKKGTETAAKNIVVDSVKTDEGEEFITCMFNSAMALDLNSDNVITVVKGDATSLSEIKKGDIVSVAKSDNKINGKDFYILVVERTTVKGNVQGKTTNGISLDNGKEYDLSTSISAIKTNYLNRIEYAEITLSLDVLGNIAYTLGAQKAAKNYAYLVDYAKKTVPEEYAFAKVFTQEGKMEIYELASKVKIDGANKTTADDQIKALSERWGDSEIDLDGNKMALMNSEIPATHWTRSRPVIIKLNADNKITEINTDMPDNLMVTSANLSQFNYRQSSIPYTQEEVEDDTTLKAGWRCPATMVMNTKTKSPGGKFFITSDSVIFAVPEIDTYGLKDGENKSPLYLSYGKKNAIIAGLDRFRLDNTDDNYAVFKVSDIKGLFYDVQAYDVDPDTGVAGMVVIRGARDESLKDEAHQTKLSVFIKKTTVYDVKEDAQVTKVYMSTNGNETTGIINLSTCRPVYANVVNALNPGDIIRFSVDKSGVIDHIERVMNLRTYGDMQAVSLYSGTPNYRNRYTASVDRNIIDQNTTGSDYMQTYSLMAGRPLALNGSILKLGVPSGQASAKISTVDYTDYKLHNDMFLDLSSAATTVITVNPNQTVKVVGGSISDMKTIENLGVSNINETSIVLLKTIKLQITEIVIINGLENMTGSI